MDALQQDPLAHALVMAPPDAGPITPEDLAAIREAGALRPLDGGPPTRARAAGVGRRSESAAKSLARLDAKLRARIVEHERLVIVVLDVQPRGAGYD